MEVGLACTDSKAASQPSASRSLPSPREYLPAAIRAGSPQRELGVIGVLHEAHETAFLLGKMGLLEANGIDVGGADGPAAAGVYWPPPHGISG